MTALRRPDITPEICAQMVRAKGSHAAAARALGISQTTITARLNPLNAAPISRPVSGDSMTEWGYVSQKMKLAWPHPHAPEDLRAWIKGAQAGQSVIVATSPWKTFPKGVQYELSKAEREAKITLTKGKIRVEMTRL